MVSHIDALLNVTGYLENWEKAYEERLAESDTFHVSLTLADAKALADLLAAADRPDLAVALIERWTTNDPGAAADAPWVWRSYIADYRQMGPT